MSRTFFFRAKRGEEDTEGKRQKRSKIDEDRKRGLRIAIPDQRHDVTVCGTIQLHFRRGDKPRKLMTMQDHPFTTKEESGWYAN